MHACKQNCSTNTRSHAHGLRHHTRASAQRKHHFLLTTHCEQELHTDRPSLPWSAQANPRKYWALVWLVAVPLVAATYGLELLFKALDPIDAGHVPFLAIGGEGWRPSCPAFF